MSKMKTTHLPELVDHQFVNSTHFLSAVSTYSNDVTNMIDYIDLYSVASIHKANKQVHDPVTNGVNFYKQLNDNTLKLKHNTKGVYNPKHTSDTSASHATDVMEQYGLDEITETDTEFIVYWVEKYRTSHDLIKKLLHDENMLPKTTTAGEYNGDNIYFNDFSESMYSLKSTTMYNPPRECVPVWDVKCTTIKDMGGKHTVPNKLTGTSIYNVHKDTQMLTNIMSRKTTTGFRNNMKNIIDCVAVDQRIESEDTGTLSLKTVKITDSKQSHGTNLMCDAYHVSRMWGNAEPLARIVVETLKNMSYVLNYMDINMRTDIQAWGKYRTGAVIEETISSVDLLHNTLFTTFEETPATRRTTQSELS